MLNDLALSIAAAIGEDLDTLKLGTSQKLEECAKRQAFYLVLRREGHHRTQHLAAWLGRRYIIVWSIIKAAQSRYDTADPLFFKYYTPAQEAHAAWQTENEKEVEDDDA